MDRSTKHEDARLEACRIPALEASLALLDLNAAAKIDFYPLPRPEIPGTTPEDAPVVSVPLAANAGTVNEELFQIQLTVPVEGQITGADPETGTEVGWAQIVDGDGDWWGDVSVSDEFGTGEIKLQTTTLYNGAFCRLTSAVFQG